MPPASLSRIRRAVPAPRHALRLAVSTLLGLWLGAGAVAQTPATGTDADEPIRQAREAWGKRDKARLASLKTQTTEARHPLAAWVDYWDQNLRLSEARAEDLEAFYARWPGSYQEDRLRNDWLLELGRRRDWAGFSRELPRFRMNDDREVACYAQLTEHLQGRDVRDAARRAWLAQREPDDGCQLLATTLYEARQLRDEDLWRKIRHATEHGRLKLARRTADLVSDRLESQVAEVLDKPARYLKTKASALTHHRAELAALAVARVAASDPAEAAELLQDRWGQILGPEHGAWAWAVTARHAAVALRPEALDWSRNAWSQLRKSQRSHPDWSDETLGWLARAALRLGTEAGRWEDTLRAIEAMSPGEQADPTWVYWRARALQALAKSGEAGEPQRAEARQALTQLAGQWHFYGQLAAEDLGRPQLLPARPASPSAGEREAARRHAGFQRALAMIGAGLRPEGVREWNYGLLGLGDREVLAAASLACEREVWDRCINSAERARTEVDMALRFPTPLLSDVLPQARAIGLDPAFVYGLVRQESRFIVDARSHVGAAGLMQVMPATAKWTARKIGLTDFKPAQITERETNLRIGTAYLKLVLDSMDGSQPMAAAAYNAGPGRPRRWREGPPLEPAMWIENIPFNETRDYVKKVSSNATYYQALMTGKPATLKSRLGTAIGPRDVSAPPADPDLP